MKSAVRSKILPAILALVVGGFALWWYFKPYPWLGAVMAVLSGGFIYFILTLKSIRRLHRIYYIGLFIIALGGLVVAINDMGVSTYLQWVNVHQKEYYLTGQAEGALYYPCTRQVPQVWFLDATFLPSVGIWETTFPSSLTGFLFLMIPFAATTLVFGRTICGWLCPFGGLNEAMVTGKGGRWQLNFLKKKTVTAGGVNYTGLKTWVKDTKYGVLVAVVLLSVFAAFPIVCVFCPTLWLSSRPVFWGIIGLIAVFAIALPFMTKRRWWCQICPLGALNALINKISLFRVRIDKKKCTKCLDCVQECRMYSMTPAAVAGSGKPDADCIRCARCAEICPEQAIDTYLAGSSVKVNRYFVPAITIAALGWYTWFVVLIANKIVQFF